MQTNFKSIRVKYTMTGLAICLISLIIISVFSYIIAYHITSGLSDKYICETVLRNSAEINHWFNNRQSIIDSLAEDIEASGDFSSAHLKRFIDSKTKIYKKEVLDFYIGFEDSDTKFISGVNWIASEEYNAKERNWYKMATRSEDVIFTEPYLDAMSGELVITVAKVLKNNGEIVGVIASDIYLTKVIKAVQDIKTNKNSYGILLDNKGRIIAHPNPKFLPTANGVQEAEQINWKEYKTLVSTLFKKKENERIELQDDQGKNSFFSFSKIESNGWYLGIAIDKSEYEKPLKNLLLGFVGAFLISIFIGLIVMINLVNKMIEPIKLLSKKVKKFSFDNTIRTPILANDEIGELGKSFNDMADIIQEYSKSLEKKVEERTRELQEKNTTIMESIGYARRLQNAIIPNISQGLDIEASNCFSIWKPRDVVGGDMFWAMGNPNEALFAIADCTGHGVPGALMSMTLSSILDATLKYFSESQPDQMMQAINLKLKEALARDEEVTEINDGADVALLYIDKINKKLIFCGAKMNMFTVLNGNVEVINGSKDSVGYSRGKRESYKNVEVPYHKDAVYYFATDGYLDQNSEKGKAGIGRKGFMTLIQKIYHLPMQKQKNIIQEDIQEKLKEVIQRDDITVVGVKL